VSPLKTLNRGYTILQDEKGKTLSSINDFAVGDQIKAILSDGKADFRVESREVGGNDEKE
jgi:exodeoxyribonuclease VII large subunit